MSNFYRKIIKEKKIEVARLKKGELDITLITIEELLDKRRTLLELEQGRAISHLY
jgi:hypothetical protein